MQSITRLSPSDLVWLWNDCQRCFYDRYVYGIRRPGGPPAVFSKIDAAQKAFFAECRVITPDQLRGTLAQADVWVESVPIELKYGTCVIFGKLDAIFKFEDYTHGVVDFKTSAMNLVALQQYEVQLQAYAYALEHPAEYAFGLDYVARTSLVTYAPDSFQQGKDKYGFLGGHMQWIDLPRDDENLLWFLDTVLLLLNGPEPPPSQRCAYCKYRNLTMSDKIAA